MSSLCIDEKVKLKADLLKQQQEQTRIAALEKELDFVKGYSSELEDKMLNLVNKAVEKRLAELGMS
jgi:hypothetical protein